MDSVTSIVQLSDLHMQFSQDNVIKEKEEALIASLLAETRHSSRVIIIFNGDSANIGKEEEFEEAFYLLENIKNQLISINKLKVNIIVVPGNHDCNFYTEFKTRDKLIDNFSDNPDEYEEDSFKEIVMKPLKNYFEYQNLFEDEDINTLFDNKYIRLLEINSEEGLNLRLNLINTSWCSKKNESPGKMNFPTSLIENRLTYLENDNSINISVLHHPLHWIEPNNKRLLKNSLESKSDLIFTGHEHVNTVEIKSSPIQGNVVYIEAKVLQETSKDWINDSGYNVVHIDTDKKLTIKNSNYDKESKMYTYDTKTSFIHQLSTGNKTKMGNLKNKANERLVELKQDSKVPIFSIGNTPLQFDDVFMYPSLQSKLEDDTREIDFNEILESTNQNNITIISGDHDSGKSSIAKQLFQNYIDKNFYPIFFEGRMLKGSKQKDYERIYLKMIEVNYDNSHSVFYDQLSKQQKILIIDNWNTSSFNSRSKGEFLDYCSNIFDKIFIFESIGRNFKEQLKLATSSDAIITHYEIKEFGHFKRMEFIEKWVKANHQLSDTEITNKVSILEKAINPLLGKSIVPRYPIYMLTLLKEIEKGNSTQNISSSAYYYDILIKDLLLNIEFRENANTEKLNNYIIELAWFVYNENGEISYDSWRAFHTKHLERFDLKESQLKFEEYQTKLLTAKIVTSSKEDSYSFTYSYVYYYFIALRLSNSIFEEDTQNYIVNLLNKLNDDLSSNVLLFLTHFSKNPFVVQQIINKALSLLPNEKMYNCKEDEHKLNELINDVPKIELPEKIDVRSNKMRRAKLRDEFDLEEKQAVNDVSSKEISTNTNELATNPTHHQINEAIKIIELMGQLLRNFYGSMEKDQKNSVAKTTFELCFKIINALFSELFKNTDNFIETLTAIIYKEIIDNNGEEKIDEKEASIIRDQIRKYIYAIHGGTLYSIVRKTALAIGDSELDTTYENILNDNSENHISFSLLKAKIEFEHYKEPNINKLSDLYKKVQGNKLITQTIQIMTKEYVYMYETNYDYRQKLLSAVNMKSTPELLIASTKIDN